MSPPISPFRTKWRSGPPNTCAESSTAACSVGFPAPKRTSTSCAKTTAASCAIWRAWSATLSVAETEITSDCGGTVAHLRELLASTN